MPSPFPGMDPYLEGSLWSGVHAALGLTIARQLVPKLRPKYAVRVVTRFIIEDDEQFLAGNLYPDVSIAETIPVYATQAPSAIMPPPPVQMMTVMPEEIPLLGLEIRSVEGSRLVTAIEILSPTNKRGEGYQEYIGRRNHLLASDAHLLEIDLLRQGRRVPTRYRLPDAAYFIFLSRDEKKPLMEIWPIQLSEPLPTVPIPLLPEDEDVALDLQLALTMVYDELGYDLSVDYTRPPEVPLTGDAAAWATDLLRK